MSEPIPSNPERRLLPDPSGPPAPSEPRVAPASMPATIVRKPGPQLGDLSREEVEALAEEFGLDPGRFTIRQHLVAALHERRQLIATLDRDALVDVLNWAGRVASPNTTREQLAIEVVRTRSMRFGGLSHRGLYVLARLRGAEVSPDASVAKLTRELRRQEGFFARVNRKRRAWIGSMVGKMIGEEDPGPVRPAPVPLDPRVPGAAKSTRIKEDIEQSGLFGGIANRVKKSADSYLNQKLDEIEARIDRKLDEIDRRLAEWRDKEIANRIRILKITLWASVIVATVSLIYGYLKVNTNFFR